MRNHRLLTVAGTIIVSLLSSLLPVIAANLTYGGQTIYKDSNDNIYNVGANDDVTYRGVEVRTAPTSDSCGYMRLTLRDSSSTFPATMSVNGTSFSLSTIPNRTKNPYKCKNGVISWDGVAPTDNFQVTVSSNAGSMITKNIYFAPAQTGGTFKQGLVTYTADLVKKLKENACGFTVFPGYPNSQKKTSNNLSVGSTSINIATLPINPNPPECAGGSTLLGSATNVATFGGASLYRTTKAIYYAGLTSGTLNMVGYDTLSSKSFSIPNTCGMVRMKYSEMPTSIKVGANSYTPATMSLSAASLFYACSDPGYAALTANTLYKLDGKEYVYKTADLTLKRLVAESPVMVSKNIAVNACGFATIPALNTANGFTTGDKVTINGSTPYTVTTLPLAPTAPTCKNGVVYLASP
jgi:hypothetical protein